MNISAQPVQVTSGTAQPLPARGEEPSNPAAAQPKDSFEPSHEESTLHKVGKNVLWGLGKTAELGFKGGVLLAKGIGIGSYRLAKGFVKGVANVQDNLYGKMAGIAGVTAIPFGVAGAVFGGTALGVPGAIAGGLACGLWCHTAGGVYGAMKELVAPGK
ncbi:MAG: hypothetical protein RDV48_25045 [Candidatus Eremiobacteraeota bacterium]|nr:hypothetical protein [Candidatus Eremiobacteraeota bacterium]